MIGDAEKPVVPARSEMHAGSAAVRPKRRRAAWLSRQRGGPRLGAISFALATTSLGVVSLLVPTAGVAVRQATAPPPPTVTNEAEKGASSTTAPVYASINPEGTQTTYVVQYGTTASYGQQTAPATLAAGYQADAVSEELTGLSPSTVYHFRFVATNSVGPTNGSDATFTTAAPFDPTVTGETAENITSTGAVLYASIDAMSSPTNYVINYGTTSSYGQQTASAGLGASDSAQETSEAITGLSPNTTYHFQFVATNGRGSTSGNDTIFTTAAATTSTTTTTAGTTTSSAAVAPTVSSEQSQGVGSSSATLSASINPNGAATTYVVDYGTTSAYGHATTPVSVGAGSAPSLASQSISGLQPKTVYHYRFVASNAAGTTNGADTTLTTTSAGSGPPPPLKGRSVNLYPTLGTVLVNGHRLSAGEQVPFGAVVDTTHGTVTLESISPSGKVQSAKFYDGIFKLVSAPGGVTELDLTGGSFGACTTKGMRRLADASGATTSTKTVRSLWGNGHGTFTTEGRYAAATVRGTIWETVDRCDGTLVKVTRDSVAVTDIQTGKVYTVAAGHAIVILAP